jgi:hypothetical protein
VEQAVYGVPAGAALEVRVADCDTYDPAALAWLARWLCGAQVRFVFAPSARRVAAEWMRAYTVYAAQYVGSALAG